MKSLHIRAGLSGLVSVALALGSLVVTTAAPAAAADLPSTPAPLEARNAQSVTADVLPTAQIDSGVVWTTLVVGNTVYAGGSFSAARPAGAEPGVNTVPRTNLLAFDLTTGALTSFAPTINGQVKALAASPDGTRLYVGGSFTTVNGTSHYNLVAFDTATGAVVSTFKAQVGGSYVNGIAASGSAVYVGGLLAAGNGVARKNLMAFDTAGKLLTWAPNTDLQVDAMVLTPKKDKVIIGGRFALVNGSPQRGLAALDVGDGSILPWIAPSVVKNGWNQDPYSGKAGIYSLSADANAIYGTGWVYANATVGNLEGSFAADPDTGAIRWLEDCHGDTYSSYSDGTNVYLTGHNHDCASLGGYPQAYPAPGNLRHAISLSAAPKGTLARSDNVSDIYADWSGQPAPAMVNWFPDWTTGTATGQGQAGWTATGKGDYLVIGGEFPYVNGKRQQGLVRFARPNVSGAKEPPRLSGSRWVPTARSFIGGQVTVGVPANWDRDDLSLTYTITRSGTATPVFTKTMDSNFWTLPSFTYVDKGLTPGKSYTYQVTATDPSGNQSKSAQVSVTVSSAVLPSYSDAVLSDGAGLYWRFGGSDGAYDLLGLDDGIVGTGVTTASTGAIAGSAGLGYTFDGTGNGLVSTSVSPATPGVFSLEGWFRTSTTSGGKLFGYGDSQTGTSGSYDRHVYMTNDGRLVFGVWNNRADTVTTSRSYNDGSWHYVMAGLGAGGMVLYLDGQLVGTNPATTAQPYSGYWRVGGDNLNGWPNQPSSSAFAGDVDEFAVYPAVLGAATVQTHYRLGLAASAPTPEFTSQVTGLSVSFDGSASTVESGQSIAAYNWDFGDGGSGTGVSPTHSFPGTGSFPVTLTVVDGRGVSGSVTHTVTVKAPHTAPVPVITTTTNLATVSADGSASTTSDGASLEYSWDWGDGSATSSGATASHTYASSGRYTITLSLLDSENFSATGTRSVIVSTTPLPTYARDVLADGASLYYRLGGTDGTWDQLGTNDGVARSGVSTASTGALGTSGGRGAAFNGTSDGLVSTSQSPATPSVFSLEGWFRTSSTSGGKLFGYGNAQSGSSSNYDRHVYMTNAGKLVFGVWNGQADIVTSPASYNDGSWHYVVAGIGASGMVLYVDGQLVASNGVTTAQPFGGYWRVGGDNLGGWPNQPSNSYFTGDIDEFAVYPKVLSAGTVLKHFQDATAATPPSAAFTSQATDLTVAFDASASAAEPGVAVASYGWDFGDGATGTGVNPTHDYADPGSYVVKLTVVDSRGVSGSVTHSVTVTRPHAAPTASFTTSPAGLTVGVDASASSATDGADLTYSWNWGDGTPAGAGKTANHTYAAAGDYTVVLTLTDSLGGSATTSQTVSPAHAAPVASFTLSRDGLTASVDAGDSTAGDGDQLTYAWNWGDGSPAGSGKTATHTYTAAGDYSVTLTVTDEHALTDSSSKTVTVAHAKPVAAFSATPANLAVQVDASGSTASDAATLTYAWGWGDGTSAGSGKTAQHTYGGSGTYTITLTVTDSLGSSDTATKSVSVTDPNDATKALADFSTDVASGWGAAKTGGTWTTSGGSGFSTSGGVGRISLNARDTKTASLNAVSVQNLSARAEIALDKVPVGGTVHVNYDVRKTSAGSYRLKTRFNADGTVNLMIAKVLGTTETSLASRNITGLTYTAGAKLTVVLEATTTSGVTSLRAKAWASSGSEPSSWLLSTTNSDAALAVPGAVALQGYLPSSVTSVPTVLLVDNLKVVLAS